jgi:KaiC/GvpD/RAD55 family RecA-like ATPase
VSSLRDHAVAFAERGFRVFPCIPQSKKPVVEKFYDFASSDPEAVTAMWTDPVMGWEKDFNIGVSTDNMIVVDIDMKNGKNGLASYVDLDLPLDTLMVRTPTGGLHAYLSGPSKSLSVGKLGDGLDIRSFHGYVIAPGSVLPEGAYVIDNDAPIKPAPPHLIAKLDEPRERSASVEAATDLDNEFAIARAAKYLQTEAPIAIEGEDGDGMVYRVACIVKDMGLSQSAVLGALLEYYMPRCAASFSPDEQAEWFRQKVENVFTYALSSAGAQTPDVDFAAVEVIPPRYLGSAPVDRRWQRHGDELDFDASWLFYELMPQRGVVLLSGASQSGKTFVLMHMARSIATGKGGAIILTGEGRRSVKARMAALDEEDRLPIVAGDINNLSASGALEQLVTDLQATMAAMQEEFGVPVRMVAIDTLSASGLLRDENDNSEAGVAMKALSVLSDRIGALVVLTHHPPKQGQGQRGAGAIFNDVDVVMEVVREKAGAIRELQVTKARDAQQRSLGVFTLIPRELGRDSRGRAITSCYVSDAPPTERDVTRVPKHVDLLIQCVEWGLVEDATEIEGEQCVDVDIAKGTFKERYNGSKDPSNLKKKWDATLAFALESGAVKEIAFSGRRYLTVPNFA